MAVSWPLWKDGGIRVSEAAVQAMARRYGLRPMPSAVGLHVLRRALRRGAPRLLAMYGEAAQMRAALRGANFAAADAAPSIEPAALQSGAEAAVTHIVAQMLKVRPEDLDASAQLPQYGFDSTMFMDLAARLNRRFGLDLSPSIFYARLSIAAIAAHLANDHKAVVASDAGDRAPRPSSSTFEPVAVIGMAGAFPMAQDLDAFWRNLVQGVDCITEIPQGRRLADDALKWGGFIDGVDAFDPLFFGISRSEAAVMDPQQRLLMTYVWKVFEDADIRPRPCRAARRASSSGPAPADIMR